MLHGSGSQRFVMFVERQTYLHFGNEVVRCDAHSGNYSTVDSVHPNKRIRSPYRTPPQLNSCLRWEKTIQKSHLQHSHQLLPCDCHSFPIRAVHDENDRISVGVVASPIRPNTRLPAQIPDLWCKNRGRGSHQAAHVRLISKNGSDE